MCSKGGTAETRSELLRRMMSDLDLFVGATPLPDDVTCMLLHLSLKQ